MIRYKLRQEKQGGYLLDCRRGTSLQLPEATVQMALDMHGEGTDSPDWARSLLARHFPADSEEGRRWWNTLASLGLTAAAGLRELQTIPLAERDCAPDDCLAAPARIYFELTRRCNLVCRTCFNNSHSQLAGELTAPEVLDILAQLDELGTFEIRFTGGEPTEHPSIQRIIAAATSHGFYVSMGTNGVYSDDKRAWVYDMGVRWFIVSLDGTEDVNDRVRGRGVYRQVVRTLHDLAQRPDLRVRLNMVVGRHNVHTIGDVACLADEHGVESLNLIPLRPYGRSLEMAPDAMFSQHDFYAFIKQVQSLRCRFRTQLVTTLDLLDPVATTSHDPIAQKKRTCAAGVEAAVVGANGDFYGCSYSPASFPDSQDLAGRRLFVAGNLRRQPVRTVWRDSTRWAVFRNLERYKNPRCQACPHYGVRCVGSCPIMGYFLSGQPNAFDPYCFVDIMTNGARPEAVQAHASRPALS